MNAKKLKSGNWRARMYSHSEIVDGRKVKRYVSFTARTKHEAEQKALEWRRTRDRASGDISLYEAVEAYIRAREGVLSHYTLRSYKAMLRNHFSEIGTTPIQSICRPTIELWVSSLAKDHSPKTVKNVVGLFTAVYKTYTGHSMSLHLPQTKKPNLYTPTDDDIRRLLAHTRGKDLEIAISLAAFCSLRRGEICALTRDDFKDGMVYVTKAMVKTLSGEWDEKQPKTVESVRAVPVPREVMELIERKEGLIVDCNPTSLSNRFKRAVKFAHLEHPFRFHDLRHYYASTAHYLGIPDVYVQKNGGWASASFMRRVYTEAMQDKQKAENEKMQRHISAMYDTKDDTKDEKTASPLTTA